MDIQKDLVVEEQQNPESNNHENEPSNNFTTTTTNKRKNKNNMILIPDFFMNSRLTKMFPHLFTNSAGDWTAPRPRLIEEKEAMHRIL